jgi:hypothetical protein
MVDSIKITALQDIGANLAYTTLVPVVNMAGTPTTQKANLQNLGNFVLNGAGGSYFAPAARAILAQSVTNAAQPNITSVGTLTSLTVTGNITAGNINGGNIVVANFYYGDGGFLTNVVANSTYSNSNVANYLPTFTGNVGAGNVNVTGTVYANGLSSTGLASLTILNVSTTANLGAVGNITITGGSNGQVLTTNGNGVLSWSTAGSGGLPLANGNSNFNIATANGNATVTTAGTQTWTFDGTGNLNLPLNGSLNLIGGGISQANDSDLLVNAYDSDGIVSSSLEMLPGDTVTRLEQWSEQDSDSWTTSDWSTGVYTTQGGLGAVEFTGATNIVNFVNSLQGTGDIYFSVNGGPLLLNDGYSAGPTDITFYTPTLPATDPTVVTTFEYFYSFKSGFEIDYDDQEVNIYANDADINIQTTSDRDITLDSSGSVTLTANSALNWTFDTAGNLTLPLNSVVYETNIPDGALSGSAIALKPIGGTSNNQQLLIYPTAADGDHVHLTSGNLYATELFLGSDNLYVKLANTGNVVINSNDGNSNTAMWTFDTAGNLTAPGVVDATGFTGDGSTLSNVATKVAGSWSLASGNNTVSISVPLNGTYSIWVNGNIPNGIVTYTATAVVTNTNVPVLGSQYAWYYEIGNALVVTSIPDQFVGTVGSISNVNTYAGNTANVFTFGITNNSGNTAIVNYGYTKL